MESKPATTAELVSQAVRDRILAGEFEDGTPIRQEELASRYGVSRIPARDALRILESEGFVEVKPNRGAYVLSTSRADLEEIYDLRILLEVDLLVRAVPVLTERDLATARGIHAALDHEPDLLRRLRLDQDFHRAIYEPAQRHHQAGLVFQLRNQVSRYEGVGVRLSSATANFQTDHAAILHACELRDTAAARAALGRHLDAARAIALSAKPADPAMEDR